MSNKKVYPVTIEALRKLITSKYYNASVEVDEKKRKPDNPDYWSNWFSGLGNDKKFLHPDNLKTVFSLS